VDVVNGRDVESDLRRVLGDPAHQLPDALVPLERVHAGVRRRRARHRAAAVAGAAAVVVAIAVAVPWQLRAGSGGNNANSPQLQQTSSVEVTGPSPSPVGKSTRSSSAPDDSVPAGFVPVSVTAVGIGRWWVLGNGGVVVATGDGSTFSRAGSAPSTATEVRFATELGGPDPGHVYGWAVLGGKDSGSIAETSDTGTRWTEYPLAPGSPSSPSVIVEALEAGNQDVYALVRHGSTQTLWTKPIWSRGTSWTAVTLGGSGTATNPTQTNGPTTPATSTASGSAASDGSARDLLAVQDNVAIVAIGAEVWTVKPASPGATAPTASSAVSPCAGSGGPASLSATVGSVWLACAGGPDNVLYRSGDGSGWQPITVAGLSGPFVVGAIDATHAALSPPDGTGQIDIVDSAGGAPRSSQVEPRASGPWGYLAFTNSSDGFALSSGSGYLYRTIDGGLTWRRVGFG
jgi:hypothetical protein